MVQTISQPRNWSSCMWRKKKFKWANGLTLDKNDHWQKGETQKKKKSTLQITHTHTHTHTLYNCSKPKHTCTTIIQNPRSTEGQTRQTYVSGQVNSMLSRSLYWQWTACIITFKTQSPKTSISGVFFIFIYFFYLKQTNYTHTRTISQVMKTEEGQTNKKREHYQNSWHEKMQNWQWEIPNWGMVIQRQIWGEWKRWKTMKDYYSHQQSK